MRLLSGSTKEKTGEVNVSVNPKYLKHLLALKCFERIQPTSSVKVHSKELAACFHLLFIVSLQR
jgi:hypothetical protein